MEKPDSIIFDMDGTLWDALDTYVNAWNKGFKVMNVPKTVTRDEISFMMGWEGRKVLEHLLPEYQIEEQEHIYKKVNEIRAELAKETGGIMYEGVKAGLQALSQKYKLFILSNCPKGLVKIFTDWAGISEFITDEMEHGVNLKPKSYNIRYLMEKHQLKKTVYVGDTDGDSRESAEAGVPFVFLSYGFGKTEEYNMKFDNFTDFTNYFIKLA